MTEKQPTPPEKSAPKPAPTPEASEDASLIPFVSQAFTNLFNRLDELSQELTAMKTAIEKINDHFKTRLEAYEPQVQEILSNVREQRRSSVTHYSQLAASVAQGFESLGELRSATTDKATLQLLQETLQAAQDALYCLRMERLLTRYMGLYEQAQTSTSTKSAAPAKSKEGK